MTIDFCKEVIQNNPELNENEEFMPKGFIEYAKTIGDRRNKMDRTNRDNKCYGPKCGVNGKNVDLKKTDKYNACDSCNNLEHFNCASIEVDERLAISDGATLFYCTNCVFRTPAILNNGVNNVENNQKRTNDMIAVSYTHLTLPTKRIV